MEALLQQHRSTELSASLKELCVLDLHDLVDRQDDVVQVHAHLKTTQKLKLH
jgi:hypothetical protein